MSARALPIVLICFVLFACGVKSDLERPTEQVPQQEQKAPSKPPVPLGEPTKPVPPYTTGP